MPPADTLISTQSAAFRSGCSQFQLNRWAQRRAVTPTVVPDGSGSRIGWSTDDVARLSVLAAFATSVAPLPSDAVACVWRLLNCPPGRWPEFVYLYRSGGRWVATDKLPDVKRHPSFVAVNVARLRRAS